MTCWECRQEAVKKAYHKLALRLHPDKNPGDEEAHQKFQELQSIYAILGDPDRRKVYDETGITSDDLLSGSFDDLKAYFNSMFHRVTKEAFEKFEAQYRGSEREAQDLLSTYTRCKGRMKRLFQYVMCSDAEWDSHRFMDIIEKAIEEGTVLRYKPFTAWAEEVAAQPRPKDPFAKRPSGLDSEGEEGGIVSLAVVMMAHREASAQSLIARMEAKYGGGRDGRRKLPEEPSEEEFQAARARLFGKQGDGVEVQGKKRRRRRKNRRGMLNKAEGSTVKAEEVAVEEEAADNRPARSSQRKKAAVGKGRGSDSGRGKGRDGRRSQTATLRRRG